MRPTTKFVCQNPACGKVYRRRRSPLRECERCHKEVCCILWREDFCQSCITDADRARWKRRSEARLRRDIAEYVKTYGDEAAVAFLRAEAVNPPHLDPKRYGVVISANAAPGDDDDCRERP